MKDAARIAIVPFTVKFEGSVPTMYCDNKGLITIADGNLIDPKPVALSYVEYFMHKDGTPATLAEVDAEWELLHANRAHLAVEGWKAAAKLTKLHLTPEGIAKIVAAKIAANEHYLVEMKGRFPEFPTWPADAQILLLSMAWACGPAFHFPKFEAACHARKWAAFEWVTNPKDPHGEKIKAYHHHMEDSHNPGLVPRNAASVVLALNAEAVEAQGLDPEVLYWPQDATAGEEVGESVPDTQPAGVA